MKLNRSKASFGQHETFPLRYGWMTKGVEALRDNPRIFVDTESAMVTLGVGSNMIRALQYWMRVTRTAEFEQGVGHVTDLGLALLGEDGDPYLEDEATIWILHWLISSNAELATGFFWFFNRYNVPRFQDKDSLRALSEFVEQDLKMVRSASTLKSDMSTLLRMYAPVAARSDEHLDSPLSQLQLLDKEDAQHHRSVRTSRPHLPPVAMHFALQGRFNAELDAPALHLKTLLVGDDDYACPSSVFRLTEDGLMTSIMQVIDVYPRCYELRESAGLHQLYRLRRVDQTEIVRTYFRKAA